LAGLSLHEKLLLLAIARYFKENEQAYAQLSEVERFYAVTCEEFNEKPNSHTQVWKYTQYLSSLGILKTEVATTSVRGRSTQVSLLSIPAFELEKELSGSIEVEKERS
jgi:cell division control protein 6